MKSFYATGVVCVLGIAWTQFAQAQQPYGSAGYSGAGNSRVQAAGYRGYPATNHGPIATGRAGDPQYFSTARNQQPGNLDPELLVGPNQPQPTPTLNPESVQQEAPSPSDVAPQKSESGHAPHGNEHSSGAMGPHGMGSDCWSGSSGEFSEDGWFGDAWAASCGQWYGNVGGLVMTRDRSNYLCWSYDNNSPYTSVLSTDTVHMQWAGRMKARLGRYLNGGQNAIEGIYWGLYPADTSAEYNVDPLRPTLRSSLDFSTLDINGALGVTDASDPVNNAEYHRLRYTNNFQNVELNLLGFNGGWWGGGGYALGNGGFGSGYSCGVPMRFSWMGGVRYFRFDEAMFFHAESAADALCYDLQVDNNLIGFQLGGRLDYWIRENWRLYAGSKLGLCGNHIRQNQSIYNSNGYAWVNDVNSPWFGQEYCAHNSRTRTSFLGELDVGTSYQFSRRWSAYAGYRAIAATGVRSARTRFRRTSGIWEMLTPSIPTAA